MLKCQNIDCLRQQVKTWRDQGLRCALVPTMGALHEGHLELVRAGIRVADRVIATIFINPKQFGPAEDLDSYPRDISQDLVLLRQNGAHLAYMPNTEQMYPQGFATTVSLAGPAKAGLEDRFRPHFFDGVTTVVAKLFNQAGCDYAMFGEKDYQQLMVVKHMARDLNLFTSVIGVQTVRSASGLALSSRNAYLNAGELETAALLNQCLSETAEKIRSGTDIGDATTQGSTFLTANGFRLDYLEARNANDLSQVSDHAQPIRLLVAAWLGKTRLIDNIPV